MLEFSEKTLPLPKRVGIILSSMTETREKWDSNVLSGPDFWMVWRCHDTLCIHFYLFFLFRSNEAVIPRVSWSQLAKVYSQQLRGTLTTTFWKTRRCIKIHANSFIKTLVNIMKQESAKVPWKLSLAKKYDPALQRTLHQNRWYFTCYYTLLFLSN